MKRIILFASMCMMALVSNAKLKEGAYDIVTWKCTYQDNVLRDGIVNNVAKLSITDKLIMITIDGYISEMLSVNSASDIDDSTAYSCNSLKTEKDVQIAVMPVKELSDSWLVMVKFSKDWNDVFAITSAK